MQVFVFALLIAAVAASAPAYPKAAYPAYPAAAYPKTYDYVNLNHFR